MIQTPGRPLDPPARQFAESRFGRDFSRVRVHTDDKAATSARAVDARAYTVGQHIVFAAGQYQPSLSAGQKLLVHELAHTIQQGILSSHHTPYRVSEHTDPAENEARRVAYSTPVEGVFAMHRTSPSVVARQEGHPREVPGPSARVPAEAEEETFDEATSTPRGRERIAAPATWGWGAPGTNNLYQECTVAPMSRERFIKFEATLPRRVQRRSAKLTDGPKHPFGATWPDLAAGVPPRIAAEAVQEDGKPMFRLKPTHAEMPPIKSAYTKAERFQEGDVPWVPTSDCPHLRGRAPLFWEITGSGAKKVSAGEMEHCSDIRAAFDVTLALFASVINNEAAAERRYQTERAAVEESKKRLQGIPLEPVDMLNAYGQEIEKTRARDTVGWHEGVTVRFLKPQKNDCKGYLGIFDEASFPEVGEGPGKEKHPPEEVMQGRAGKTK